MNFIHPDHLNTPRLVADAAGTTVWRWDQAEPFGVNVPDENPSALGAFELPVRFPGQYADKETGQSYNYFRDYDPSIGRYSQSDPIGLSGGMNTYSYVGGGPIVYVDPLGLIDWSLPQGLVNFSAGFGDALLLGTSSYLRELVGADDNVDQCSAAYAYGGFASLAAGGARLAYAGLSKVGAAAAASGVEASAFRESLKSFFRVGMGRNWRQPNLIEKTDAQLRASAGKTNLGINTYGAGVSAVGASNVAQCRCAR